MLRSTHVGSIVLTAAILIANSTCAVARDDFGRDARPESWKQDASLGDIFFLDLNHGWAVGDQGVILRTTNGGADWIELSDAGRDFGLEQDFSEKLRNMRPLTRAHELRPFTCSWHSIHFVDEKNGWVAGSYQSAYVDRQRAIVMNTHDGGATWQMIQGLVLPKIARLHFRDVKNGWAVGRSGNLYKSGMSYTADGGQSWANQGNKRLGNWSDGDEIENGFVTVDGEGRLGVIRVNEYEPSVVLEKKPGCVRAVRMVDNTIGWAAGSNGTILTTRDGGLSWSVPESVSSQELARTLFDFSTLCIVGDRIWIAGNPGTYVYTMDVNSRATAAVSNTHHHSHNETVLCISNTWLGNGSTGHDYRNNRRWQDLANATSGRLANCDPGHGDRRGCTAIGDLRRIRQRGKCIGRQLPIAIQPIRIGNRCSDATRMLRKSVIAWGFA